MAERKENEGAKGFALSMEDLDLNFYCSLRFRDKAKILTLYL